MTLKLFTNGDEYIAYNQLKSKSNQPYCIIFLSGFNSDMEGIKALYLEELCQENSMDYIRFDYFGHGISAGEFIEGTIGTWLSNVLSVIDQLTNQKLILVGSSMGGWLMSLAAEQRPERIAGLVGLAAAPDFTEELIWDKITDSVKEVMKKENWAYVNSAECLDAYPISLKLIEDARNYLILNKQIKLDVPIRLVHGTSDLSVPYNYALGLAQVFTSNDITIKLIKNADHRLSTPENLAEIKTTILEIMDKICSSSIE